MHRAIRGQSPLSLLVIAFLAEIYQSHENCLTSYTSFISLKKTCSEHLATAIIFPMPAPQAACMPDNASSNTIQSPGSTPIFSEAFKYMAG
jgi:hypothetical protein